MEEDKEDDPNTIISFPRRDSDGAGHGAGRCVMGWGEEFTRGRGRGLVGQGSDLQCSNLMGVWFVHNSLDHVFQKQDAESRPGFKRRKAPQIAHRINEMHHSSHSSNLFFFVCLFLLVFLQ